MTTDTITIPNSLRFAGAWLPAHWSARVVDETTGKIEFFIVARDDHGLLNCALRLTTEDVALLRKLPAFTAANAASDGADPNSYDCRCNQERIAAIEELAINVGDVANNAIHNIGILYRQVDDLRTKLEELEELVGGHTHQEIAIMLGALEQDYDTQDHA